MEDVVVKEGYFDDDGDENDRHNSKFCSISTESCTSLSRVSILLSMLKQLNLQKKEHAMFLLLQKTRAAACALVVRF